MSIRSHPSSRLSPEYVLLGFLYRLPSHGYDLHKQLSDQFGSIWHASQSQIYNILNRLEAQGYITSTFLTQEKLPPRQILKITDSGAERFESWLNKPTQSSVHAIRVEFVTRLYFIQMYYPDKVQEMMRSQIEEVNDRINQLHQSLTNLPSDQIFNRLGLDLRIRLLGSVISWLGEYNQVFGQRRTDGD